MKRAMCLCVILIIAVTCSHMTAMATTTDDGITVIQSARDFSVLSINGASNGDILLSGYTRIPMNSIPTMVVANLNGEVKWSRQEDRLDDSSEFRSAKFVDNDTVIALLDDPNDFDLSIVQYIKEGQVISQTKPLHGALGIYPAVDGIIVYSGTHSPYRARISKITPEGEQLWKLDWTGKTTFRGILAHDNIYVAYGYSQVEDDNYYMVNNVVVAFDEQGNLLWRHEGTEKERCEAATISNQGDIILVSDKAIPDDVEFDDPDYVKQSKVSISAYNESGLVWRTEYKHADELLNPYLTPKVTAITAVPEGFLMSAYMFGERYVARMALLDDQGNTRRVWTEPLGDVYGHIEASLLEINERMYMIVPGYGVPPDEDTDDGLITSMQENKTIIKEITVPS